MKSAFDTSPRPLSQTPSVSKFGKSSVSVLPVNMKSAMLKPNNSGKASSANNLLSSDSEEVLKKRENFLPSSLQKYYVN